MIKHNYKCQGCGNPAEVNYRLVWIRWGIKNDGSFVNMDFKNVSENEFWCSKCFDEEIYQKRVGVRK